MKAEVAQQRSLLEVAELDAELAKMNHRAGRLPERADIDHHRRVHVSRREEIAAELNPDLLALYERQRSGGGPGAALLQGGRCGACRIEIDRGELARISAATDDEVLRCPECGAILLRAKAAGR